MNEIIEWIKTVAAKETNQSSIFDSCGGNYDDAYSIGLDDGEIMLARTIVHKLSLIGK